MAHTTIPIATGTSTIAKTSTTLTNGRLTLSSRSKCAIARLVISGRVTIAITEFTAVRVTLSATSPRKRWLNRFAVVPPGEAASSIIPTASSGGRSNSLTSPKQTAGSSNSWQPSATATARGCRATRRKSAGVSESPSPNMMIPSAIGSPIVVNAESMGGL